MPAPKGNQNAEKYDLNEATICFNKALDRSKEDTCLCVQDAVIHSGIKSRTFYSLCEEHVVLQDIKREINDNIIVRINNGALTGKYNTTAGIWRMKQLGESDVQSIRHEVTRGITVDIHDSGKEIATSETDILEGEPTI